MKKDDFKLYLHLVSRILTEIEYNLLISHPIGLFIHPLVFSDLPTAKSTIKNCVSANLLTYVGFLVSRKYVDSQIK